MWWVPITGTRSHPRQPRPSVCHPFDYTVPGVAVVERGAGLCSDKAQKMSCKALCPSALSANPTLGSFMELFRHLSSYLDNKCSYSGFLKLLWENVPTVGAGFCKLSYPLERAYVDLGVIITFSPISNGRTADKSDGFIEG